MESILRNLLEKKGCSFDRYLNKIQYIKTKDDIRESLFLTPVITSKKSKILFITREIKGNWFESIKDIDDIILFVVKNYNYKLKDYNYYFHIYIENIKFEHFYKVDTEKNNKLSRLSPEELEKIL